MGGYYRDGVMAAATEQTGDSCMPPPTTYAKLPNDLLSGDASNPDSASAGVTLKEMNGCIYVITMDATRYCVFDAKRVRASDVSTPAPGFRGTESNAEPHNASGAGTVFALT